MPRKHGHNSRLSMKQATTYGTAPTGNWDSIPFADHDLAADQDWIEDDTQNIAQTGDPQDQTRDVQRVGGTLTVPLDTDNFGWHLKGLFGGPITSGATNYTHVYQSGADSLPDFGFEAEFASSPYAGKQLLGMMYNSLSLSGKFGTNRVKAEFGLLGSKQNDLSATGAGTPATATLTRFLDSHAVLKKGGTTVGDIKEFSLNYANNLEAVENQGASLVGGYDPGTRAFTGSFTTRFLTDAELDDATAGTVLDLEFLWEISATKSLLLQATRCRLSLPRLGVRTPMGIDASFNFVAAYDATPGAMLTATLKNQIATYPDPA